MLKEFALVQSSALTGFRKSINRKGLAKESSIKIHFSEAGEFTAFNCLGDVTGIYQDC